MNTIKNKVSHVLVTGACAGLGAIHFIAQTTADVVSEAEAQLLQRRYGSEIEDAKNDRMKVTVDRQQHILEKVAYMRKAVRDAKSKFTKPTTYEPGEMLPMVLVSVEQVQ